MPALTLTPTICEQKETNYLICLQKSDYQGQIRNNRCAVVIGRHPIQPKRCHVVALLISRLIVVF